LSLHILGATVWAGGHLVLAMTILPNALRQRRAAMVNEFEQCGRLTSTVDLAVVWRYTDGLVEDRQESVCEADRAQARRGA
jgi:uncharacterized membrane protein